MRLIVKSPVWDDLREIGQHIAKQNPDAADRFFTATKEAFDLLMRHPGVRRLRSFSLAGLRSWVVPGFENYFYLPTETELHLLAVLHGARDLPKALEERLD